MMRDVGIDGGMRVAAGRRRTALGRTVAGAVALGALALALVVPPTDGPAAASPPAAGGSGALTLAGTGTPGFTGDGGPATAARLDAPGGIAEDGAGDLFIADTGNCRVREVPARTGDAYGRHLRAGTLVTLAGGPCRRTAADPPPTAVALDRDGDLFVAYASADRVAVLPAASGTVLGVPVVRGRLTTVAGDGTPGDGGDGGPAVRSGLDDPGGLAADATGDLFIADTGNCRIRMVADATGVHFGVAAVTGEMTTVAGDGICGSAGDGGPAGQAEIWDPGALAVDPDGDLLVADQGNRTIRVLAGGSTTVLGVAVAAGDVATVAGEGSYGPYLVDGLSALNETAELNFPTGLAVDAHGDLFVADGAMHAIRMVPAAATVLRGRPAAADDMYTVAGALSVDNLDSRTSWIQTRMLDPTGLAVAPDGRLVYADAGADEVRELPAGS